jgi:hypothetical protein
MARLMFRMNLWPREHSKLLKMAHDLKSLATPVLYYINEKSQNLDVKQRISNLDKEGEGG